MTAYTPHRSRNHNRIRTPKFKTAALTLYAVAATGLLAYFLQTSQLPRQVCVGTKPAAAPVKTKTGTPATAPASPDRSGKGVTQGTGENGQSVRNIDLSGVGWKPDGGVPLPESAQAGPRDTAGGLAAGYADSPEGALLAAVNVAARTSWQFGPSVFGPTVTRQVTGKFAGQLLSSDQEAWDSGAPESAASTEGTREYAYAVDSYSPSAATLEIVSGVPGAGTDADTQIQVAWERGDWRVVAPPGGDWANASAPVPDTAPGFTPFPGQGD